VCKFPFTSVSFSFSLPPLPPLSPLFLFSLLFPRPLLLPPPMHPLPPLWLPPHPLPPPLAPATDPLHPLPPWTPCTPPKSPCTPCPPCRGCRGSPPATYSTGHQSGPTPAQRSSMLIGRQGLCRVPTPLRHSSSHHNPLPCASRREATRTRGSPCGMEHRMVIGIVIVHRQLQTHVGKGDRAKDDFSKTVRISQNRSDTFITS